MTIFKVLTNGTTTFEDVVTLFPVGREGGGGGGGGANSMYLTLRIDEGYKSTKPLTTKCYT